MEVVDWLTVVFDGGGVVVAVVETTIMAKRMMTADGFVRRHAGGGGGGRSFVDLATQRAAMAASMRLREHRCEMGRQLRNMQS